MKKSKSPKVSVVMSVYNGEKYLKEAIDSILNQTFKDFEFIIINDGSTDNSLKIIKSYKDPRIILISRKNKGLVDSLNEGIKKAKGEYIARMDADDISLKERFKKQVEFLDKNTEVGLVASTITLIDSKSNKINDSWPEDINANNSESIYNNMPKNNCIAHPSIMARSEIMKNNKYNQIRAGEDYNLWLRLLSAGTVIDKINKPLLKYRVHEDSITQNSKQGGGLVKIIKIKRNFLYEQLSKGTWGKIEKATLSSLRSNYINYKADHNKNYFSKSIAIFLRNITRAIKKQSS